MKEIILLLSIVFIIGCGSGKPKIYQQVWNVGRPSQKYITKVYNNNKCVWRRETTNTNEINQHYKEAKEIYDDLNKKSSYRRYK